MSIDTDTRIADELAIRNTIARVAHLADMGLDPDEYVENFTEEADWLMPGAPRSFSVLEQGRKLAGRA